MDNDVVADVAEEKSGYELWGMRPKHVAVVNPVMGEDAKWTMSLCGEWDFVAHPYRPERRASWGALFAEQEDWGETRKIRIPGLLEAQGVGEPGISRTWDCHWDCSPKPLNCVFAGAGWYRREFTIPAEWAGKRIWLKIGDVTSQAWFWVNGVQIAWHENYCGAYKYEITDVVKPGEKAKFVIQVSNMVAKRGGTRNSMNIWCGIQRVIELEATPQTYIEDAWCRGDFDGQVAEVSVEVKGRDEGEESLDPCLRSSEFRVQSSQSYGMSSDFSVQSLKSANAHNGKYEEKFKLRVEIEGDVETVEVKAGWNLVKVPLKDFRPWSPEKPNLYVAKIELIDGEGTVQTRFERFGVRKFEVRGQDFYLNNKPFFIRGIGYHNIQPVYGSDRIGDREYRRMEVAKMRASGFNFIRLHTRCETPEFFDVCDELGMMVQPELPYYTDVTCEKFEFNPVRDVKELYIHYRRHPSFAIYSHGNEGSFGPALGDYLYKMIKAMDPDRLVIEQDCCADKRFNPASRADYISGPINEWPRGSFRSERPIVAHEYLNLSIKANAQLEDKYTGIWQVPFGREKRRNWLAKSGLTDFWGDKLQLAQHALQAYWLKHGLESARNDEWCDGYYYWSAQDTTTPNGENYSAQGLFDPFWGNKPCGSTPDSVSVFNSASVVLCDMSDENGIVTCGETVTNRIRFAHYGDDPLKDAKLRWTLSAADGKILLKGETGIGDQPLGGVRDVADITFEVPAVAKSIKTVFAVEIEGVKNSWNMWLFPKRRVVPMPEVCIAGELLGKLGERYSGLVPPAELAKAKVVVAPFGSNVAAEARELGKTIVEIGPAEGEAGAKLGWWWLGKKVGTAIADHPALSGIPHDDYVTPAWFRILRDGMLLPVEGWKEQKLLMVTEGANECRAHFGCREIEGRREYFVNGLDVLADLPEAISLLDGLLYAAR